MPVVTAKSIVTVFVLLALSFVIYAQAPTGTITGIVTDESGAAMPNVTVTITEKATGAGRTVTTNAAGLYSAPALPAGDYEVKAEAQGFRTDVRDSTVQAGGTFTVNLPMTIGATKEVVNVEAATTQMNYESNAVQGVIDLSAVQDLPLNGRSFMQLAVLEPGVTIANGSTAQFNALFTVSVLGGGNRTAYTVDGGNISDSIDTGGGISSLNLPQDVVQEFQLSSVNFDIATDISSGGAINIVTRSGTNQFHGSAYFYYRDHNMSAYPGLQRQTLDPSPFFARRNPGATLGGPVLKDKLFFFFNIEHTNQVQAILTQPNTPLAQAVAGVYNSPYSGTQVTAKIDYHISAKHSLFARYSHDGNSGFGEVFSPQSNPSNWIRNINWADQSIIGLTSSLTPSIVNDARIQYMYWSNHNLLALPSDCVEPSCIGGGLPGLLAVLGTNIGFGGAEVGANPNAPQTRNTRRYEFDDSVNWALGSHRLKFGGQVMRVPSVGQWGFCTPYCEGIFGPQYVGGLFGFPKTLSTTQDFWNSPFLSLSSGIFTGIGVGNSQQPPAYDRDDIITESQYRLFVQDTWKIKPNFTLNYGLAWNAQKGYFTPLNESPFLTPILGANNLGQTPNAYKEFQPIVGFAWSPGKSNKTVIRAGGGLYWDSPPGYYHNRTYASNGPVGDGRATLSSQAFTNIFPGILDLSTQSLILPGAPIPVGHLTTMSLSQFNQIYNQQIGAITAKLSPTPPTSGPYSVTGIDIAKSGIEIFPPQYPIARSYQINAGIQRDLGHNMVLTADYAMRQGENVSQSELDWNLNSRYINGVQTPVIPTCKPAQLFVVGQECSTGPITFWTPYGHSRYNGLLLKLNKRLSQHLQFTASYQLAKQNADTSPQDLLNYNASYGATIPRHTLNVAGTYVLPWGFQLSMNMSYISRLPVNVNIGSLFLPGTAPASTTGAEPIPGLPYNCFGVSCTKSDLANAVASFNTNIAGTKNATGAVIPQVVLPSDYQLGDPTITQDFALQKVFTVKERYKFQITGQVFNAFNISNLTGYAFQLDNKAASSAAQTFTFGQPTGRAFQTFGSAGPRAFQIAGRFTF
ncbi:MAG TPA: carboxypeptidase regulatory-like domain-containing protein, partial [Bryobacteraceae bacterium]|nr:carboxypeptidase regulatory-like domain-containing protein [Bryobacteraceae bacterium]